MNPTIKEKMSQWKQDLHQIPELGLQTPKTAAYCQKALEDTSFQIDLLNDPESDSFVAFLDLNQPETIAFRTDMDALPVMEKTGLPYSSRVAGRMHACGHDGHMSLALATAHELDAIKDQLPVNILLIFQAGEETPGGACRITAQNILEKYKVRQVFGTHLWPMLDQGVIATRPLELMSRASEVTISIEGKSSHAARYKEGLDALEAGASLLLEMYAYEKTLPRDCYRLLRFGKMEAGTVCNAVAAHCVLEGTMRAFQDEIFDQIQTRILELCRQCEQQYGVHISVKFGTGYPAVLNDVPLTEAVLNDFEQVHQLESPEMISEDFSEYQRRVPGVFFFLGTGTGIPLHADHFVYDVNILENMVDLYLQLALHPVKPV